jgi:hypothetical protein
MLVNEAYFMNERQRMKFSVEFYAKCPRRGGTTLRGLVLYINIEFTCEGKIVEARATRSWQLSKEQVNDKLSDTRVLYHFECMTI